MSNPLQNSLLNSAVVPGPQSTTPRTPADRLPDEKFRGLIAYIDSLAALTKPRFNRFAEKITKDLVETHQVAFTGYYGQYVHRAASHHAHNEMKKWRDSQNRGYLESEDKIGISVVKTRGLATVLEPNIYKAYYMVQINATEWRPIFEGEEHNTERGALESLNRSLGQHAKDKQTMYLNMIDKSGFQGMM